ncbi:MAG: helix-turn-helix domain-containing protein [Gammaproteobacteria bacterium]|uniref:GlxA family transcriptional regulator n=1 Tax=Marinomonas sp. ef1 TaxID=2005043 RepID=UPI000C2837BC|nr:helix-turn-helix domain-containing protein [Marinomonas sp. ef1]MBU1293249.1 helix-turn-helix domain-containing protein [Gammaproteobacteria bacterium]MBU1465890.1 helix-turn-helix domain-containing protein [Gammaproteobacteria bacterium]MBU2022447.1 helix-turn-helix domain-containing protein [Gammaproteobacteria bacterium]MBU2238208.1 helix-turn-helix domain-containing protein [Gammaproteobacteria bacterium]MBU2320574.1 helix-turn-helix domain-containing protein [Gammaproteobacteria bacter
MSAIAKIPVYFIMLPNSVLLDTIGPAEAFQYSNRFAIGAECEELKQFELHFVGPETKVENTLGLDIQVEPLPDVMVANSWVVSTGLAGDRIDLETPAMEAAINWLGQRASNIGRYISICAGTLLFAKAGLLAGRACTTHHMHLDELQETEPSAKVLSNRLFAVDGDFYSSAGVTAGIDLALYLIQQEFGANCASQVARHMVLFSRRGPNDPSQSPWLENRNHFHQSVHRVQDAIQVDPARDWSLECLADVAQCSPRQLVRLFKESAGVTTREYIHKLRLALAMQFLQSTSMPIEEVAERCGFDDPRQFRRLWARQHSFPPSHYRAKY